MFTFLAPAPAAPSFFFFLCSFNLPVISSIFVMLPPILPPLFLNGDTFYAEGKCIILARDLVRRGKGDVNQVVFSQVAAGPLQIVR